jgi:predicted phosphodiesterase
MTKIAFVGDIHGEYWILQNIDRRLNESDNNDVSLIIQSGDFGWYPKLIPYFKEIGKLLTRPVLWIDGNHENYSIDPLASNKNKPVEVAPNITYMPRGTVQDVFGLKMVFMGGAASVDYKWRTAGYDWFPEEIIKPESYLKVKDEKDVDVLVTHTPPQSVIDGNFDQSTFRSSYHLPDDWTDPSARIVENLWEKYGYPKMYCGHMHRSVVDRTCRILDINEVSILEF